MDALKMLLSVVATMYNSAQFIEEFCNRVHKTSSNIFGSNFEIILVDDGSPDDSLNVAKQMLAKNTHIKIIELSRNFGHHRAMMTGLMHATGEKVFLLDIDLEEEPEILFEFYEIMQKSDADVVYGQQATRKGKAFERISGKAFYKLLNIMSNQNMPTDTLCARLMTQDYVAALVQHKEREIYMAGLWHITGFKQLPCIVKKHARTTTNYTLRRKIVLAINAITSFSNFPLYLIFYFGIGTSFLAFLFLAYVFIKWFFLSSPLEGWTSLVASVWLMGGLSFIFMGVIGIYLSKIFLEVKQRPYTTIRKIYTTPPKDT